MKKALPVRTPVYLNTEIISDGKSYAGIIGNLSENGAFVETIPTKTAIPFMPGKPLKLKFKASSKNTLNLNCEVVWLYTRQTPPNRFTNSIGLEIKHPPAKYKKYFKTL